MSDPSTPLRISKKKKILVADDDTAILEVISLMLEDAGYEVKTTIDGQTEMVIREYLPDVILLDIWMAEKIAKEAGADSFLAKPFEMEDLLNKVEKYTNK